MKQWVIRRKIVIPFSIPAIAQNPTQQFSIVVSCYQGIPYDTGLYIAASVAKQCGQWIIRILVHPTPDRLLAHLKMVKIVVNQVLNKRSLFQRAQTIEYHGW